MPELQTNFAPQATPAQGFNFRDSQNNGISYADPVTGQMKFIVSSKFAFDKNYALIPSPEFLRACPGDKYAYHIIPFLNNPDKFYIIQFQNVYSDVLAAQTGLQVRCPNAIGLGYSVLDLSLNNGLGNFSSMNNVLLPATSEGITLIRHANGKDTWVIVHKWQSNQFYAYLFTDGGVSAPVISSTGPQVSLTYPGVSGNIISSHDGKTIAAQIGENHFIELYDFDNAGGTLKNYRNLAIPSAADRMVFSPDDSKLYFIGAYWTPGVFQFDFNASNIQNSCIKIAEDEGKYFYDMQLAPDGKIYINGTTTYDPVTYKSDYYLAAIKCPNLPKYACNYNDRELTSPIGFGQFPDFVNDYITQPKAPRITEFSLGNDTSICFGNYKLSAPEGWQNYRWNTGEKTREVTVSRPGLYYVLAGEEGFSCPSAFGSIKLKNAARQLDLGKDTVLCPNMTYTLQAPGNFTNLLWSDGTTVQTKVITTGSTYSLIAQDANGCTNWDTISIGFKSYPRASFGPDTVLCTNQSLLLQLQPTNDFGGPLATYLWQNASTKNSFTVTQPGTYWGRATYQGCTVSDTIHVDYVSAAGVNLGADTALCTGDSLLLRTTISNAACLWSTGETASSITVRSAGRYWVKVNNGSCVVMDTINVGFRPAPAVFLGNDTLLCDGGKLILQTGVQGASYLWQDGSAQSTFNAARAGVYWVKATVNGCSKSDSMVISYKPLPELNLGKDTGLCVLQTLLLNAAHPSAASYMWQDGSTQPVFSVNKAGVYNVSVTGTNGCVNKDHGHCGFWPASRLFAGQ